MPFAMPPRNIPSRNSDVDDSVGVASSTTKRSCDETALQPKRRCVREEVVLPEQDEPLDLSTRARPR